MSQDEREQFVSEKIVYIRGLKLSINKNFRRSQAANAKSAVSTYCSRVDKRECIKFASKKTFSGVNGE